MVVKNVVVVCPFEEEEEGTCKASDSVKMEVEDPDTPGYLRGDRVRLGRWRSRIVGASPLARSRRSPGTVHIDSPNQFNKTKQHTHTRRDVRGPTSLVKMSGPCGAYIGPHSGPLNEPNTGGGSGESVPRGFTDQPTLRRGK